MWFCPRRLDRAAPRNDRIAGRGSRDAPLALDDRLLLDPLSPDGG